MRAMKKSLALCACGALLACTAQGATEKTNNSKQAEATRVSAVKQTAPQQPASVPSLAPMLKRVAPAVVNISVEGWMMDDNPLLKDPRFRQFFHLPKGEKPFMKHVDAAGSGVIFDAARGLILTNHHVVEHGQKIYVTLHDHRQFRAKLVASDPGSDVAILQIPPDDLTQIAMGDSKNLHVGDYVVAIGDSFAVGQAATLGIVSALGRTGLGIESYENFIQTDAAINPGNSGGALVDLSGRLIGINTAILSRGSGNVGVGFAIPVDMVQHVAKELLADGKVSRGELGVVTQDLTPRLARALGAGVTGGAVVSDVQSKSPADAAGLKPGDIITSVDGSSVSSSGDLRNAIGSYGPGTAIHIALVRSGSAMRLSATLGAQKAVKTAEDDVPPPALNQDPLTGAMLGPAPKSGNQRGVFVAEVGSGSEAEVSGLKQGDIIESANHKPVHSADELKRMLHAGRDGSPVLLRVKRGGSALFLAIG